MKISHLKNLEERSVSHDLHLKKKVMIENGVVEHLTNFSQAIIPPGESVSSHSHEDMTEIFFVRSGEGTMSINGKEYELEENTCVCVEPKELHSIQNSSKSEMILIYFGVV